MILFLSFFFNVTAPTEIYTLSLHDALPISIQELFRLRVGGLGAGREDLQRHAAMAIFRVSRPRVDRKSTRLNSSHQIISYAVFCLKKKKRAALRYLQVSEVHMWSTTPACLG